MKKIVVKPRVRQVVYSNCFGGFGLSDKAIKWLEENACEETREYLAKRREYWNHTGHSGMTIEECMGYDLMYKYELPRHDADLVRCVETLGTEDASGRSANLVVKELSGRLYRIDEYDGKETVIDGDDGDWIIAD